MSEVYPKTNRIAVRLRNSEHLILFELVKKSEHKTISGYVRELVLRDIKAKYIKEKEV